MKGWLLGGGLVPLDNALSFPEDPQWDGHGMNHIEMPSPAEIFGQLKQRLR